MLSMRLAGTCWWVFGRFRLALGRICPIIYHAADGSQPPHGAEEQAADLERAPNWRRGSMDWLAFLEGGLALLKFVGMMLSLVGFFWLLLSGRFSFIQNSKRNKPGPPT
jgi:hypothetical protein